MSAVTFALLLGVCQEDVYIRKIDKVRYIEATQACREAEAKIETDESAAIDKLTRILQDSGITEIECNLRIQVSDIYGPPYLFLPYQYRARARLSLAKKTPAAAERKQLIEEAIRDLKTSVGKKVASSQKYLDAAQADLAKLAEPAPTPSTPTPPVPAGPGIRARVSQLLTDRRYKSARTLIETEGASLPEAERSALMADAQQACRGFLTESMRTFRKNWTGAATLAGLRAMTRDEFDSAFALPDVREIAFPYPAYDWARAHLETLRGARSDAPSLPALLAMAEGAAKLDEDAENPWYALAEELAHQVALREVDRKVADAAEAPRARRDALLSEAGAVAGSWTAFVARLDPTFRKRNDLADRHAQSLTAALNRAPADAPELEKEDLRTCFDGFPVTDRLLAAERKFEAREAGGGLTRESRQKVLTLIVAARALRLLLEGKSDQEVQGSVRGELEKLSRVGGAADPDRFGPRVRRIFDSLR